MYEFQNVAAWESGNARAQLLNTYRSVENFEIFHLIEVMKFSLELARQKLIKSEILST